MIKKITLCLLTLLLSTGALAQSFEGGTGRVTTETFETTGPWSLNWDFEGTGLRVTIHHADTSRAVGEPIRMAHSGKGSIDMKKAGRFYLHVRSVGDYTISVEQGASEANRLPKYSGGTERKGSPIFSAPRGWRFRGTCKGTVLKVTLFDANRNQIGEPMSLIGSGSVVRKVGTPGKYFFMIKSVGPYELEVLGE